MKMFRWKRKEIFYTYIIDFKLTGVKKFEGYIDFSRPDLGQKTAENQYNTNNKYICDNVKQCISPHIAEAIIEL